MSAIAVREYVESTDRERAEQVERMCEVGPSGEVSLFTDLLGDPMCRIRHSPTSLMLVAETCGPVKQIVGLIRGSIKTVTCGTKNLARTAKHQTPIYTKLAYILGLRVAPSHRRMGVALKLVTKLEEWFRSNGAEYSYIATENDNTPSLNLFTARCGYRKFRTPSILVQPVHAHRISTPRNVSIVKLSTLDAVKLYREKLATTEFFPQDIDSVLNNVLSLGTYIAIDEPGYEWSGFDPFVQNPPRSWAVVSVWDSSSMFRLEVKGVSKVKRVLAKTSRALDRAFKWMRIPSVPDLFRPFGFYFLYGLGGEGETKVELVRALCGHAHNMARDGGCGLVVAEVAECEPLREGVLRWKRLSCDGDMWCVKRLVDEYSDGEVGDWTKAQPGPSIFVDPREF